MGLGRMGGGGLLPRFFEGGLLNGWDGLVTSLDEE